MLALTIVGPNDCKDMRALQLLVLTIVRLTIVSLQGLLTTPSLGATIQSEIQSGEQSENDTASGVEITV